MIFMIAMILGPATWGLLYAIREESHPFASLCSVVGCGLVGLFAYGLLGILAIASVKTVETVAVFDPGTYQLNADKGIITTPDGKRVKAAFDDPDTPLDEDALEILEPGINNGSVKVRLTVRKTNEYHWFQDLFLDKTDRFLYAEYAYGD